jgi:hypothetical protein
MSEKQSEEYEELHLNQYGMSGRGVRVRQLPIQDVREIEKSAAESVGPDGNPVEYGSRVAFEGLCRMIRGVTIEPVVGMRHHPEDKDKQVPRTLRDEDVEWEPMTLQKVKAQLEDIFTAKDVDFLEAHYHRLHSANQQETLAILGKVTRSSQER